jgi:hypothetical protein
MTTPIAERLALLPSLTIAHGAHPSSDAGMCVMEAVAYIAGEPHSDHPTCASPFITGLLIRFNDRLRTDEDRDRLLKPIIPLLIGTRTSAADDEVRAYMAADWLIRQRTPAFLRIAGFNAEAETLEGLARVVDASTARAARAVAIAVRDQTWKIRNERWTELRSRISAAIADIADIAASAASAAIAASAASADIAAIADIAASAAIADIAAIAASAASADIAAIADIADIADSATPGVVPDAIRAAIKAATDTQGDYWQKRDAAYAAAKSVIEGRLDEWPKMAEIKAEAESLRLGFVQLIREMCAVGKSA